jgi:hypothetical protein
MIKSTKAFLLAGASALAILASAAEANAETFVFTGAAQSFTASVSGEYAVELLGASGGTSSQFNVPGGLGAEVSGDVLLTAGEVLTLFVGGQGESGGLAGGGGGGSFVFDGTDVLAVAANGGGGGAGVKAGPSGYGGDSQFSSGGFGGTHPLSGGGAGGFGGGMGGFGGGQYGGGGGGSYLSKLFTDPVLTTGGASRGGNGSISVELLKAVPEPSTWAMMLAGFAGLGWLARTRGRKTSAA